MLGQHRSIDVDGVYHLALAYPNVQQREVYALEAITLTCRKDVAPDPWDVQCFHTGM
jgi:hypothetical protein